MVLVPSIVTSVLPWIMPRRTLALPLLEQPFSRRYFPLSPVDPVSPAYRAWVHRSYHSREKTSSASISAVSTPRPRTRPSKRAIALGRVWEAAAIEPTAPSISLLWSLTRRRRAVSRLSSCLRDAIRRLGPVCGLRAEEPTDIAAAARGADDACWKAAASPLRRLLSK